MMVSAVSSGGAVNYYNRMITQYAKRAAPLTSIMAEKWSAAKGTMKDFWTDDCDAAFDDLRTALMTAPVLALPDSNLPYVLQTDASDKALGGVLMQIRPDNTRVVIAFLHHKFDKVEQRWPIHERELYGLVHSLRKYRHYLMGAEFVYEGDHKPLAWLRTQKHLSPKQARWLDTLESFNWTFKHVPGKDLTVPDAISRTAIADDPDDEAEFQDANNGGLLAYLLLLSFIKRLEDEVVERLKLFGLILAASEVKQTAVGKAHEALFPATSEHAACHAGMEATCTSIAPAGPRSSSSATSKSATTDASASVATPSSTTTAVAAASRPATAITGATVTDTSSHATMYA